MTHWNKPLKSAHILIIGDNVEPKASIASVFSGLNFKVTTSPYGGDSVELLKAFQFDMIILDIASNEIDKLELMRNMLAYIPISAVIPVIAITSKDNVSITSNYYSHFAKVYTNDFNQIDFFNQLKELNIKFLDKLKFETGLDRYIK